MRIDDPSQLSNGMEVFKVDGFNGCSAGCSIRKHEIVKHSHPHSPPSGGNTNPSWMTTKILLIDNSFTELRFDTKNKTFDESYDAFLDGHVSENSMQDAGIILNNYNYHQVFDSLNDAKRYACSHFHLDGLDPRSQKD